MDWSTVYECFDLKGGQGKTQFQSTAAVIFVVALYCSCGTNYFKPVFTLAPNGNLKSLINLKCRFSSQARAKIRTHNFSTLRQTCWPWGHCATLMKKKASENHVTPSTKVPECSNFLFYNILLWAYDNVVDSRPQNPWMADVDYGSALQSISYWITAAYQLGHWALGGFIRVCRGQIKSGAKEAK